MAIKIPGLTQLKQYYETKPTWTYKDLALDIQRSDTFVQETREVLPGNDIKASYDTAAIKNSLRNLFNTRKGQRFLFPEYGLDLYRYLFEPISREVAEIIGEDIKRGVELFEPRVRVLRVEVTGRLSLNTYDIKIFVEIPTLADQFQFDGTLDIQSQSFIFFEGARNR